MKKDKAKLWHVTESLKGDKVVWMILFLLMMISVVTIFSSTSLMADSDTTRVDIMMSQLKTIIMGLVAVFLVYKIFSPKWLRICGKFSFIISAILLGLLISKETFLPIKAAQINGVWRILKIGGFQIHIFEAIKVLMVLYLAWAVDAFNKQEIKWPKKPLAQKILYIYFPMVAVFICMATGSGSSAVFTMLIMVLTILIGGLDIRDVILPGAFVVLIVVGFVFVNHVSGYKILPRQETWESRIAGNDDDFTIIHSSRKGSKEYRAAIDHLRQPYAAKIAVKEGGLLGKGPGRSTQRYTVAVMYEDFMYSFIIEEYGVWGAIVVMALYMSLLARGSIIARNSSDQFSKITVAGLVLLISGQAFLHILVNVDVGPMTGQTLPIISHGKSALFVFCAAFGIILSVSKPAEKKIATETQQVSGETTGKTSE